MWFAKLRQWWHRRKLVKARGLLRYWDGLRYRYGDPFAIWRKVTNHPTVNVEAIAPLVDEGKEPESTQFVTVVAEAFDAKRWDSATGVGLTDAEVINLLGMLGWYIEDSKKNFNRGQTSPPATGLESSTGPAPLPEATQPC